MELKVYGNRRYIQRTILTQALGRLTVNTAVQQGKLHGLIIQHKRRSLCLFDMDEIESYFAHVNPRRIAYFMSKARPGTNFLNGHEVWEAKLYKPLTIFMSKKNQSKRLAKKFFIVTFGLLDTQEDEVYRLMAGFHKAYRIYPIMGQNDCLIYTPEQEADIKKIKEERLSPRQYFQIKRIDSNNKEPESNGNLEDILDEDL